MADALERFAAEGAEPFYRGRGRPGGSPTGCGSGAGPSAWTDLAAYEPIEREPVRASFRGAEVLTNPPPSSGGILIAYALGVLERLGDRTGVEQIVEAIGAANERRTAEFAEGLHEEALCGPRLRWVGGHGGAGGRPTGSAPPPTSPSRRLEGLRDGHLLERDRAPACIVPGTGVHVNNMLGEEDLNPQRLPPHPARARG